MPPRPPATRGPALLMSVAISRIRGGALTVNCCSFVGDEASSSTHSDSPSVSMIRLAIIELKYSILIS